MPSPRIEPIAIVGLGCRFPGGADTSEKLWQLAYEGRQCWEEVPSNRYNWRAFHHPDPEARGTHNARGGFFLQQDPAVFDANFFAIPAAEAAAIDPQQRLLLEVSYEALENAGIPLEAVRGTQTGVYVALVSRDYDRMIYKDPSQIPKYHLTGCGDATACGRISYVFDLKGPCVSMDTGCSGSMVALHLACQALRVGETNAAIVAGTNLLLGPDMTIAMSALHMINENGRCYPFDSRGSGYGRAEGVAALVLKRLEDAVKDGDPIRAVIRNTGINQDGKTNGIMLPSAEAQQQLTSSLYRQAGIDPHDVCYIETHGTGTQAGDAAEVTSIKRVFASEARTRECPLFLGSIKANLGHSESTSGLAGVIKTVIALENAIIPPLAALETLKPDLHSLLESTNIIIPSKPVPWPHDGARLASVNSFGFGGTNAHVILESAPSFELQTQPTNGIHTETDCICIDTDSDSPANGVVTPSSDCEQGSPEQTEDGRPQLYVVSAKSKVSLEAAIYNVRDWVLKHGATYTTRRELSRTLCHRRSKFNWRASIVASSQQGILSSLEKPRTTKSSVNVQVVFLFTGQGAQYARMGRELVGLDSVFARSLDQSQEILTEFGAPWHLVEELLREESASRINSSELSQPATTAIQIALVDMLAGMNVRPSVVLGHSSGEVAAAYAAGILGRREALMIAYHKGFVADWCRHAVPSQGAMLAVGLGETQVMPYLQHSSSSGQCTIACVNSPSSVTLSGDQAAVAEVQEWLDRDSIFNRRLKVDIAYHSHHMQAVAGQFGHCLRDLPANKAKKSVRFYSSVTGSEIISALGASYWVDNLVSQVRFGPALEELTEKHFSSSSDSLVLVEIGPHSALQGPIRQIMNSLGRLTGRWTYISSLVRNKDALVAALEMIGGLFEHGVQVDLAADLLALTGEALPVVTGLPPYPWDHSNSYWQESRLSKDYRFRHHAPHDLLGLRLNGTSTIEPIFRHVLSVDELPWLQEHIIDGFALYPGSAFLCMAIEALKQVSQDRAEKRQITKYMFRDISFSKALVVPDSPASIEVLISLKPSRLLKGRMGVAWEEFRVTSVTADGTWNEHCRGSIRAEFHEELEVEARTGSAGWSLEQTRLEEMRQRCQESVNPQHLYSQLRQNGIDYGNSFAIIRELHLGEHQAIGRLNVPNITPLMPAQHMHPHVIHPTVFDAFMHIVLPLYHRHCSKGPVMLTSIGEASISADILNKPGDELLVACRLAQAGRRHGSVEVSIFQCDAHGDLMQVGSLSREDFRAIGDDGGGLENIDNREQSLISCYYYLDWAPVQWWPIQRVYDWRAFSPDISISCLARTASMQSLMEGLLCHVRTNWEPKCSIVPDLEGMMNSAAIHIIFIDASATSLAPENLIPTLCRLRSVLLVTVSGDRISGGPALSPSGLARIAEREVEGLLAITLDYQQTPSLSQDSLHEIVVEIVGRSFVGVNREHDSIDREYVYRDGALLVPRLKKSESADQWLAASVNGSSIEETGGFHTSGCPLQLHFKTPGLLDSAVFVPVNGLLNTLEPDEVSVKVYAHAVNRVDIAIASDRAEPTEVMMGEFAGVVVAVGSLCEGAYRPGDRVCGWGSRPYTNIARVKCHMVHRLDDAISFVEGASIPIAFQSATYALTTIARLERGQTVLIHGAAGAVGQAAISIAQHIGADIYATVGSPEKKQLLAEQKGIPTNRIFSSRTAAFRDDVLNLTDGRGVDVVINCSSGDVLDESIPCVADFGYMIDLTKSKIPLSMDRGLGRNITFASINMRLLAKQRPRQLGELFSQVMALYQERSLAAIAPITTIPISDLNAGFRLVQSQRYAGKIVLDADETVLVKQLAPKPELPRLTADGIYAVVGGSAALNRTLCCFLEARGAEHVLSVVSPNPAAEPNVKDPSRLQILDVDVANEDAFLSALSLNCRRALRGIIYVEWTPAASSLAQITDDDIHFSLNRMHSSRLSISKAASSESVEFCITIASPAGLLGHEGRGLYAVGSPLGVSSMSNSVTLRLNALDEAVDESSAKAGDLYSILDYCISGIARQNREVELFGGLNRVNCRREDPIFSTVFNATDEMGGTENKTSSSRIDQEIASAGSVEKVHRIVMEAAMQQLTSFLAIDPDDIQEQMAVTDLGLDSLLAIEFKNWVVRTMQAPMQTSEVLDAPSLSQLVKLIVQRSKLVQKKGSSSVPNGTSPASNQADTVEQKAATNSPLPPLPIPELRAIIDRHLSYLRAFATDQEFQETVRIASDFQAPGSIGRRLYDRLQAIKAANPDTWYHDLYLQNQYLVRNGPLAPYMTFFFTHPVTTARQSQAERAALIASTVIQYKFRLETGQIQPRHINEQPQCMDLYKYLFNTVREPTLGIDLMRRYPGNNYFVVLRRGHVYKIEFDPSAQHSQYERLEEIFQAILDLQIDEVDWFGALTAADRISWARTRQEFMHLSDENASYIRTIEQSAFVVCLDDASPETPEERGRHFHFSDGSNRWHDKPIEFIIAANGASGVLGDHTGLDAGTVHGLNTEIADAIRRHRGRRTLSNATTSCEVTVQPLRYSATSPEIDARIRETRSTYTAAISSREHRYTTWNGYGSSFMKARKIPPNSAFQLVVQLAGRYYFGQTSPCWETVLQSNFRTGRVEINQVVTAQVAAFVDAAAVEAIPLSECRQLLVEAARAHSSAVLACTRAGGSDRFLSMMREIVKDDEQEPELYHDPVYKRARPRKFISNCFTTGMAENGCCLREEDGIWLHFEVEPESVKYSILGPAGDTARFCDSLARAAEKVWEILRAA
ncbi:Choline/Carnitine o-acyltransferase-domain-containing protein [Aspergillus spinulosporus]